MGKIIFYSWESDLPNSSNRGFIEKVLNKVSKEITTETLVIDRDTAGVGGSPNISTTIFEKIKKADIFVADLSIINKGSKFRPTPNPNVLIELGYALRELGENKIISIMNINYGDPTKLPFDLKMKTTLIYNSSKDKTIELDNLVGKIKYQLNLILPTIKKDEDSTENNLESKIILVIKEQKIDRLAEVRKYMKTLCDDLDKLYPGDGVTEGIVDPEYDQKIIDGLEKTTGIVLTFRKVIDEISIYNDDISLKAIFAGFKPIVQNFDNKKGTGSGTFHKAKHDYYKFLGNEMFIILISILLREEKWDLIRIVLGENIIIDNYEGNKTESVDYRYFSQNTFCFLFRKQRLSSNRADLRYDLLMERRKNELDFNPSAVEEYTSADLLLFLKGESKIVNSTDVYWEWYPWSLVGFDMPRFILLAKSKRMANGIIKAFSIKNIQDLQILLINKVPNLKQSHSGMIWTNPIERKSIEEIGTKE